MLCVYRSAYRSGMPRGATHDTPLAVAVITPLQPTDLRHGRA